MADRIHGYATGVDGSNLQIIEQNGGDPTRGDLHTTHSARHAAAVTPSDSTTFNATKGLYLGAAGNVAVVMADGSAVTFTGLAAGVFHPLSVTQVKATGTTATGIVAVF